MKSQLLLMSQGRGEPADPNADFGDSSDSGEYYVNRNTNIRRAQNHRLQKHVGKNVPLLNSDVILYMINDTINRITPIVLDLETKAASLLEIAQRGDSDSVKRVHMIRWGYL